VLPGFFLPFFLVDRSKAPASVAGHSKGYSVIFLQSFFAILCAANSILTAESSEWKHATVIAVEFTILRIRCIVFLQVVAFAGAAGAASRLPNVASASAMPLVKSRQKSTAPRRKKLPSKFSWRAVSGICCAEQAMSKFRIDTLDTSSPLLVEACVTLLTNAFAKPERYSSQRLHEELQAHSTLFYRQFFVAISAGEIIGVGGVKAADWASHTHLLYLSAVAPEHRSQGVGRALLEARIDWVVQHFKGGRILVSSARSRRFRDLGFSVVRKSTIDGRHLMMRRF